MAGPSSRLKVVMVATVVGLVVGSCGGGDSGSTGATDSPLATSAPVDDASSTATTGTAATEGRAELPDPCGLLSMGDITEATALAFGNGSPGDQSLTPPTGAACVWYNDEPYAVVQVLIGPGSVYGDPRTAGFEAGGADDFEGVDIPGAGEARISIYGDLVAMRIGDLYVQIANGMFLDDSDQLASITRELAEAVAGNL